MNIYQKILALTAIIAVFIINVYPAFEIGFYQDDYKSYLDIAQFLNGDPFEALRNSQLKAGFRPFAWFERVAFYEVFGENVFASRVYLSLIHLLYGLILLLIVRLYDKSFFTNVFVVFFYFFMVFIR